MRSIMPCPRLWSEFARHRPAVSSSLMALYIFSDAHLGAGPEEKEKVKNDRIVRLLEMVKTDGDRLVILGDLFDFWFEYGCAIPKDNHDILVHLRLLTMNGMPIDYISGNHDFWMGDFFESQMKITVYRDSYDLTYQGMKLHLIHGDGLAPADRGYRLLKKVLRNRLCIWLYKLLPPDWAIGLAKSVSGSSREYTARRDHDFAVDYERYAHKKLTEGYDLVAIGHLHLPVYREFSEGTYVNTGDFINHFSYLRIANGKAELRYLK
jgi:UDP-2,3-diacylglucosamine hydrolase